MKSAAAFSFFKPELGHFPYAPIDDDATGIELCMLSILARLDIEPWAEAADEAVRS